MGWYTWASGLARLQTGPERTGDVALFTTLAKGTAMRVVVAMASVAGCRCRHFRSIPGRVAGRALHADVFSRQRVLGFLVVIETPKLPAVRVMASLTGSTNAAFVEGILVAGGA